MLLNEGFKNIEIETVAKTSKYNEPTDLVHGFTEGSPLSYYRREQSEEVQAQFKTKLQQALAEQDAILSNTVPCLALVITAKK
jgi:hypothetical protein